MYPIRAKYPIRQATIIQPTNLDLAKSLGGVSRELTSLKELKTQLLDAFEFKLKEVVDNQEIQINERLNQINESVKTQLGDIVNTAKILDNTQKGVEKLIETANFKIQETVKQGEPGKNVDEQKVIDSILAQLPKLDTQQFIQDIVAQIPKIDEKLLIKKITKRIPNKASLKIIQEKIETDPISVVEKIMDLAKEGKFKLKKENIEGLEQTMSAFNSQLGRGYLHGGGDTVTAGTNITITTNANGNKVINSSSGSGLNFVTNEVVSGSGTSFILANTPILGSVSLYGNGQLLQPTDGINPNDYSISGGNIITISTWNTGNLLANYRF